MMTEVKCSNPACTWSVLIKSGDGQWRFTTRALKTQGLGKSLVAVCRRCNHETELPLGLMEMVLSKSCPDKPRRKGFTVIQQSIVEDTKE